MERRQLLKNDTRFGDYEIVTRMSPHHEGEREVYLAENYKTRKMVAMTVFNLGCKRYKSDSVRRKKVPDFIDEVAFLRSCNDRSVVFAKVV